MTYIFFNVMGSSDISLEIPSIFLLTTGVSFFKIDLLVEASNGKRNLMVKI